MPSEAEDTVQIYDVWSRSGSKYRIRAVVLLLVNVLLFAGLGCFAFWLRTGVAFAPAQEGYRRLFIETFRPSRETSITLSSLLTFPINVEEVPMQIAILGLLLAALVSIPILVSILYRFPASLPFLGVVAFLAMMPWLAITLTGSCVLASVRRLRLQFRFASALLGLVLVIVYFYGASQRVSAPVETLSNPADRIKFIAPWILATVASCALMAFVLLIARVVNYRPGAIAPLLALMFVIPVALFEFHVGRDELHYRLLEHDFTSRFADRDVSTEFEASVQGDWLQRRPPRPAREVSEDSVELSWLLRLDEEITPLIADYRYQVVQNAEEFLRDYPDSRYAVAALYLSAQARDVRVDRMAFRRDRMLRFYCELPSAASHRPWQMVLENGPQTPMAAVALHRLAILYARAGDMAAAVAALRELVQDFGPESATAQRTGPRHRAVLPRKPVEATLGIALDRTVLEARRLLALVENNQDPLYGHQPVMDLLHFDPRTEHYRPNLEALIERYPSAQIADNVELELALATPRAD
ncbi:MAG: tetratricopeptide repeat protein, partial [Planctomycetota bacterium]